MSDKKRLSILAIVGVICMLLYMFTHLGLNIDFIVHERSMKLITVIFVGIAISVSSILFQVITNNRILTPSIIGLDALYMLVQTCVVFLFGANSIFIRNTQLNYVMIVVVMIVFSFLLFKLLFKKEDKNIFYVLLVGIIAGTFFKSFTSFMEVLIDPDDYLIVQDKMFASFDNIHSELLLLSLVFIIATLIYLLKYIKYLDVLALGKDYAVNLGLNYYAITKRLLIVISILVSVSTALVGPITFLGLLVVNVTYQLFKTYKHTYLLVGSTLISIIFLLVGLLLVERIFHFNTTLSVIIDFIGGVYFLYLILRGARA